MRTLRIGLAGLAAASLVAVLPVIAQAEGPAEPSTQLNAPAEVNDLTTGEPADTSPDATISEVDGLAPDDSVANDEGAGLANSDAKLVLNEVDSAPSDWVEFVNPGSESLDISGFEIRDDSDDHRWRFPAGTVINPAAPPLPGWEWALPCGHGD